MGDGARTVGHRSAKTMNPRPPLSHVNKINAKWITDPRCERLNCEIHSSRSGGVSVAQPQKPSPEPRCGADAPRGRPARRISRTREDKSCESTRCRERSEPQRRGAGSPCLPGTEPPPGEVDGALVAVAARQRDCPQPSGLDTQNWLRCYVSVFYRSLKQPKLESPGPPVGLAG